MIESIMYIGIGFLIAGLLVIGVIPLVHARAVRLTMRRLEADNPLSMAEIAAEKDQLRAEFAMTMSRLEMTVEQLKAKTTNQLTEIAKNSEAIGRIKFELSEKTAALLALEAKENQLSDDLAVTRSELADKTAALEHAERALASTQSELTQVTASFNDSSVAAGGRRVELVALRAQTEALKGQVESYEKETKALWDHLNGKTAELEASKQQLAEQRARADEFANRDGELDRQLDEQPAEFGDTRRPRAGAAARARRGEARCGKCRRVRAHGKCRSARTHRRGRRGGGAVDRHVGRTQFPDRNDPQCRAASGGCGKRTIPVCGSSRRRIQRHARRADPRIAGARSACGGGTAGRQARGRTARRPRRQVTRAMSSLDRARPLLKCWRYPGA